MGPLAAPGFHVMALSLRHCWPGSWPAQGGDFNIDTHVADVAAVISTLRKGPVALLGHSRGGHIAVRVAERHPKLQRAVILVEPGGGLDESLGGKPDAAGQFPIFPRTILRAQQSLNHDCAVRSKSGTIGTLPVGE